MTKRTKPREKIAKAKLPRVVVPRVWPIPTPLQEHPFEATSGDTEINQLRKERSDAMAKVLELVIGTDRTNLAYELALKRGVSSFEVIRRAFDEHAIKDGRGVQIARIQRRPAQGLVK